MEKAAGQKEEEVLLVLIVVAKAVEMVASLEKK